MKVVQIKGSNGSGKTTIIKQMLKHSKDVVYLTDGNGKVTATVMRDLCWIALGKYVSDKVMGGVDSSFSTVESIKQAIDMFIRFGLGDDYWLVFEGMMISTIKTTFYDYLLKLEKRYKGEIEPLFVILETVPSGCIERMNARGTKKPNLKFENIVGKCTSVLKHAATYNQKYVRYINVEATPEESMLEAFLLAVDDSETIDKLYPFKVDE